MGKYIPQILVKMRMGGVSNKSLRNIVRQNQNILLAAKKNNLVFSPVKFFTHKVFNRASQFIKRPEHESS